MDYWPLFLWVVRTHSAPLNQESNLNSQQQQPTRSSHSPLSCPLNKEIFSCFYKIYLYTSMAFTIFRFLPFSSNVLPFKIGRKCQIYSLLKANVVTCPVQYFMCVELHLTSCFSC